MILCLSPCGTMTRLEQPRSGWCRLILPCGPGGMSTSRPGARVNVGPAGAASCAMLAVLTRIWAAATIGGGGSMLPVQLMGLQSTCHRRSTSAVRGWRRMSYAGYGRYRQSGWGSGSTYSAGLAQVRKVSSTSERQLAWPGLDHRPR